MTPPPSLRLNSYQKTFVQWNPADGNLRVQASAGSGKTACLVEFVARQLEAGVPPESIVVVTFTNKAATEIRARIIERMGRAVDGLRVGTFHSLALAALRGSEDSWRYPASTLLDGEGVPVEGRGLVNSLGLWRLVLGRGPVPGTGGQGLNIHGADAFEYSGWADRFAASKLHPGWVLENGKTFDELTQLDRFTAAWSTFERSKRALKAWQFSDCLMGWLLLLRRRGRGILGAAPRRFDQDGPPERSGIMPWDPTRGVLVLVDEVQDNSLIQWELARRIAGPEGRLVCVGDARQSIYGWRGAKLDLFLQADEQLEARTLDLPVNYRSRRRIVGLGNAIVRGTDWATGAEGEAATEASGEVTTGIFETPEDEALDVVRSIRQDLGQGIPARQIAVLARTNTYALRAAVMLGLYGIPIRMLGRRSLLAMPEVAAFLGWVTASEAGAVVPGAVLSSMLNHPQSFLPRPLKDKLAAEVAAQGLDAGLAATRRLATEAYHKRAFDALRNRLDHLREHTWPAVLPAAATLVGGATDPDKAKQKEDAARNRVDPALAEYVAGTRDEDPDGKALGLLWVLSSLGEFFPDVRAFAAALARVDAQLRGAGEEAVSVGTCHGAKALEWDVVYGIGVAQGVFPSPMSRTERDFEEERRLLYVLATRPRHRLRLTWSESVYRSGKLIAAGPSQLVSAYVAPALEADEQAPVHVDGALVAARQARTLAVVAEGVRVGLDVGVAEGVRAGMVAGVGAMVRAALATDVEGQDEDEPGVER